MADFDDPRPPKSDIDRAREYLEQIDAMTDLSVEDFVVLIQDLHNLAHVMDRNLHAYCYREVDQERSERIRAEIEMLRALTAMEKSGPNLDELEKDGKADAA